MFDCARFDEDDLYHAMDALSGRWVAIEKQLGPAHFIRSTANLV
jgi:hypothetical protein